MNVDEQISLHIILDVIDTDRERLAYWVWVVVLLTYKQCLFGAKFHHFLTNNLRKFGFCNVNLTKFSIFWVEFHKKFII